MAKVCNANATNAQVGGISATGGIGAATGALATGAVDTTSSTTLVVTGQKSSGGDTLQLNELTVNILPHN